MVEFVSQNPLDIFRADFGQILEPGRARTFTDDTTKQVKANRTQAGKSIAVAVVDKIGGGDVVFSVGKPPEGKVAALLQVDLSNSNVHPHSERLTVVAKLQVVVRDPGRAVYRVVGQGMEYSPVYFFVDVTEF